MRAERHQPGASRPRATTSDAKDGVLLYESDALQLLHCPGSSDFTLIAFTEGVMRADDQRWWPRRLAARHDIDLLAVIARRMHWYPAKGMAALLPIAEAAAKPRRLAFGASMGGYAALKYGAALRAAAAIAFSPQASIDPRDAAFDRRSRLHFVAAAHRGHGIAAADLPPDTLLAYDPLEPTDARHAALVADMPGVVRVPLAHAGHASLRVLSESGEAPALFALVLDRRMAEAARLLRAARHRSPTIWLALGMRARLAGNAARGEALLARARELGAGPARLLHAEAAAAERLGHHETSLAALRRMHAEQPDSPWVAKRLGGKLMQAGQFDEAVAAFRAARKGDPQDVAIHLGLITALEAAGKKAEAAKAAAEAVEALPEAPILRVRLGKALLAAGRRMKAVAVLREALAQNPNLAEAREALAMATGPAGTPPQPTVAAGTARARTKARSESAPAADQQAPGKRKLRAAQSAAPTEAHDRPTRPKATPAPDNDADPGNALRRLRLAVARDPGNEAAQLALIDALVTQGRRPAALTAARVAAAALPASGACQARLGTLLMPQRPAEALPMLSAAISLGHASEQVRLGFVRALDALGRKEEALAAAREAAAAFPDSMDCQAQLGMLALHHDPAEAVAALRAAIALGNSKPGVTFALAQALRAQGEHDAAVAVLRDAIERAPENPRIRMQLGRMLAQAEDWTGAEAAFRAALALDQTLADAHLHLSEALRQQKRIKEAVAAFRLGESLDPDRDLLRTQRFRLFGEVADGGAPRAAAPARTAPGAPEGSGAGPGRPRRPGRRPPPTDAQIN